MRGKEKKTMETEVVHFGIGGLGIGNLYKAETLLLIRDNLEIDSLRTNPFEGSFPIPNPQLQIPKMLITAN
jgi:hypothetical protein